MSGALSLRFTSAGHCVLLQLASQVEVPAHPWPSKQAGFWKLTGTASKADFQGP